MKQTNNPIMYMFLYVHVVSLITEDTTNKRDRLHIF